MNDADGRPSVSPSPDDDARVTQRLRALPPAVPMPRDVSIRIAAAIEAEAQAARERGSLDVPAAAPPGRGTGAVAEPRGWFRRRAPQILAGVAGLGVLTFGLYLIGSDGGGDDTMTAESADSGASDDAGSGQGGAASEPGLTDAYGDREEAAPDEAPDEAAGGLEALSEQELSSLVASIAASGAEAEPGCGQSYADEADVTLLGSAELGDTVLVVTTTDGTATVEGWTLGWCDAAYPVAGTDPVVVPRPTP